jgi:hypothetical protein
LLLLVFFFFFFFFFFGTVKTVSTSVGVKVGRSLLSFLLTDFPSLLVEDFPVSSISFLVSAVSAAATAL